MMRRWRSPEDWCTSVPILGPLQQNAAAGAQGTEREGEKGKRNDERNEKERKPTSSSSSHSSPPPPPPSDGSSGARAAATRGVWWLPSRFAAAQETVGRDQT